MSVLLTLALLGPPELPPAESPPAESPPVESPPVESPPVESPPVESPSAGSPEVISVPAPEQVQEAAESGAGPVPPPEAQPPNPQAKPSEGVYAVGSSGVAPLPPPPPPVPPETIARGRWSGTGWLSVRLLVSGPIAGDAPARPTVISLGGGAEGGWRIRQWIGLGAAFTRQPHEVYREDVPDAPAIVSYRGYMSAWDVAFVRLFAPVRGRVDPFLDVGGGLAFFDPARNRPTQLGGSVRASVGFEAWIARNLTLGMAGLYRANFLDDTVGHAWQAAIDFGVHW